MKKMSEVTSETWTKLIEVPTKAKTPEGIARAIGNYSDFEPTAEEVEQMIAEGFIELCSDGVIVWAVYA